MDIDNEANMNSVNIGGAGTLKTNKGRLLVYDKKGRYCLYDLLVG